MEVKKGDIVLIEAPSDSKGTEIQKTRPAVVVSPIEMSIHAKRAIVVPLTTNIQKIYPFEVLIQSSHLPNSSKACCDQIQTVSVDRIIKKYGDLTKNELHDLDRALCVILNIGQ